MISLRDLTLIGCVSWELFYDKDKLENKIGLGFDISQA